MEDIAADVLNKQSRTDNKGWSSSLGVWQGLWTFHRKVYSVLQNVTKGLGLGRILWQMCAKLREEHRLRVFVDKLVRSFLDLRERK